MLHLRKSGAKWPWKLKLHMITTKISQNAGAEHTNTSLLSELPFQVLTSASSSALSSSAGFFPAFGLTSGSGLARDLSPCSRPCLDFHPKHRVTAYDCPSPGHELVHRSAVGPRHEARVTQIKSLMISKARLRFAFRPAALTWTVISIQPHRSNPPAAALSFFQLLARKTCAPSNRTNYSPQ